MNQILSIFFDLTNINATGWAKTLILFLVGLIVTLWIKKICSGFLKKIRFNNVMERVGFTGSVKKFEPNVNIEKVICLITQFFFITLFLMFICEAINLIALSNLLTKIILYYPNIFISILIFIICVYVIDFTQKIVIGTKTSKNITYSRFLGKIIDWSVRILAFLAILYQLQIVPQLIVVIFIGVALAISLAIGISVGLAAKKPVGHLLKELQQNIAKFF